MFSLRAKYYLPLALLLLINFLLTLQKIYLQMPGIDIPMHLAGGAFVAYFFHGYFLTFHKDWWHKTPRYLKIFILVGAAAILATCWEWYEFFSDKYLGTFDQLSEADTMGDFFCGLLGGFFSSIFYKN